MIPWGGLGCCLGAAALCLLGRSSGRDADVLNSVIRVDRMKDVEQLLDAAEEVSPLIMTISGIVGSDTPIKFQNSNLKCVMVEETAEQHFLKHNDAGSWTQDSALMLSMSKEVPWYLDDGTGRVYVVGARGATGFLLTLASEVFEEPGQSLVCGTLDYLQGIKMLGVKRVKRILPTGASLTVIGEAVKDDAGTIWIQKPHIGPFYVSSMNIEKLIANLRKWTRWYHCASMGLTIFGFYLVVKHLIQCILEKKRRWELQKRVLAAARCRVQANEGKATNIKGSHLSMEKQRMPDLCVICLEQEYNVVYVPCGHMCCCISCSSHLSNCPLCRRRIEQTVRTFRH